MLMFKVRIIEHFSIRIIFGIKLDFFFIHEYIKISNIVSTKVALCNNVSYCVFKIRYVCFVHPIFCFWFLVTFGSKVTKIRKYYVIFVYILQGRMGKMEKNWKEITQLKWPKYQKPKDKNMGWTKHLRYFVVQTGIGKKCGPCTLEKAYHKMMLFFGDSSPNLI